MTRKVGLPLAEAFVAFEAGRYGECVEKIAATRGIAQRFGGSHAQRDILSLTALHAALARRVARHGRSVRRRAPGAQAAKPVGRAPCAQAREGSRPTARGLSRTGGRAPARSGRRSPLESEMSRIERHSRADGRIALGTMWSKGRATGARSCCCTAIRTRTARLICMRPLLPRIWRVITVYAARPRPLGQAPARGYAVSDFGDDVAAFLDALGIERAAIVGHSMGAAVALQMAADYPERVSGLALLGAFADFRGNPGVIDMADTIAGFDGKADREFARPSRKARSPIRSRSGFLETVHHRKPAACPAHVWRGALRGMLGMRPCAAARRSARRRRADPVGRQGRVRAARGSGRSSATRSHPRGSSSLPRRRPRAALGTPGRRRCAPDRAFVGEIEERGRSCATMSSR